MIRDKDDQRRRWLVLALSLAFATLATGCAPDTVVSEVPTTRESELTACGIPDFPAPTLCARARADSIIGHATHLILLDESGSMRPHWGAAIDAVRARLQNLPPTATMELILFSDATTHLGVVTPALLDSLRLKRPRGAHTDLGRAAEAAADAIVAHPLEKPLFVSFITDGKQDPAPGSAYEAECSGAAWSALTERSATASSQRPMLSDFVRIGGQADVHCLRGAFPAARVCSVDRAGDIARCVAWGETQMAVRYITWRFERDTSMAAGTLWSDGAVETTARRPSAAALLAMGGRTLVDTCWNGNRGTLPGGGSVELNGCLPALPEAARVRAVGAEVAGAGVAIQGIVVNGRGSWLDWVLPKGSRKIAVREGVVVAARLEPGGEIRAIGLSTELPGDSLTVELQLAAGGQIPIWGYTLIALTLLALIGLIVWATLPPVLPEIRPLPQLAAYGYSAPMDLERSTLKGKNAYLLPMPGSAPGDTPQLRIEVRRRSRFRSTKDVLVRVYPPEAPNVQVGIIFINPKSMRLHRAHGPMDIDPPGMIVWDPPAVPWDEQLDRIDIFANSAGYMIERVP